MGDSDTSWPGFVRPAEGTQTRYVFRLSTCETAMRAGAFAMAARIYREFDADFADRFWAAAELLILSDTST
jgi:endoglucanase